MRSIALYNRQGQRLLTLKEAEHKGYGPAITLKLRIRRGQLPAYKIGTLWLVRQQDLTRPTRRPAAPPRRQRQGHKPTH